MEIMKTGKINNTGGALWNNKLKIYESVVSENEEMTVGIICEDEVADDFNN